MSRLAPALAPLHGAYLRRLDEMAARIGHARVVREPVARDEGRRLIRHESGLPLRLDLVDSATGEVFEVHGSHPDEPAAREVRIGTVAFRLDAGNGEELPVRCDFEHAPSADDRDALAELLRSWAVVAAAGGFARPEDRAADSAWSGRLHSIEVRTGQSEVAAVLDLGTCPSAAFDSLAGALADFGRERLGLVAVRIGGRP